MRREEMRALQAPRPAARAAMRSEHRPLVEAEADLTRREQALAAARAAVVQTDLEARGAAEGLAAGRAVARDVEAAIVKARAAALAVAPAEDAVAKARARVEHEQERALLTIAARVRAAREKITAAVRKVLPVLQQALVDEETLCQQLRALCAIDGNSLLVAKRHDCGQPAEWPSSQAQTFRLTIATRAAIDAHAAARVSKGAV